MAALLVTLVLCAGTLLVLLVAVRLVESAGGRSPGPDAAAALRRTADELAAATDDLAAEVARRVDR